PPPASTPFPYTTLFRSRVASAPMVRQVLRVLGTQHDGPVARPGKECLQEAPRDANTLAPRHLEDRVLRGQSHDAIPGAAPEAAVDRKSTRLNSSHVSIS